MRLSKPKGKIENLPKDQRESIHHWLFVDRYTYSQVMKMAAAQFDVELSKGGVCGYFQRQSVIEGVKESRELVVELRDSLTAAGIDVDEEDVGRILRQHARRQLDAAMALKPSAKDFFLLESVRVDEKKADIAERARADKREKWEFDAAKAALKHAAELQRIDDDDELDESEKIAAVRDILWGSAAMPPAERPDYAKHVDDAGGDE